MLKLYHNAAAICAQKVRICLAEKGLAYETQDAFGMLRSQEYLNLNPRGYVPTLVHDGKVLIESRIISEYLNEAFPDPPLMPDNPYDRARVGAWTKEIDDTLHLNIFTLSCAATLRFYFAAMSAEQREISLPLDPTKRDRTRDLIENGEKSRFVKIALERFARLFDDMERALAQSSWLVGDQYTLADADYTPYMQRLTDLGLSSLWRDKPHVSEWFDRLKARPSFSAVLKDWSSPEALANAAEAARAHARLFEGVLRAG
jgi:glutathione S-transferase